MEAVKQGILVDRVLFDFISNYQLITLEQVREKAQKYIRQEDTKNARKENDGKMERN